MATTSRIGGRLAQELDDDVEGFIRVMDDDVLLANGRQAVAAMVAHPLGKRGL